MRFNFLKAGNKPTEIKTAAVAAVADSSPVTVRAWATDKYAGLHGHQYIAARQLGENITVQTSALMKERD